MSSEFSDALLDWYENNGRLSLPWQRDRDPYKIWLSEIMLQQTQVETVIPYFERFLSEFPAIGALALAGEDRVMANWAGLGYYARARNLHKTAKIIQTDYQGVFPSKFEQVVALPGIGKSTAGAILAFSFQQRHPILDGNVKRVLARCYRIAGFPGQKLVADRMWKLADGLTPDTRIDDYTQAIMDLGATVCKRSKPDCQRCPVSTFCQALASDRIGQYPERKKPTVKTQKQTRMLVIRKDDGSVLLQKRPPSGIWGGLWSLPQIDDPTADSLHWSRSALSVEIGNPAFMKTLKHSFSHFDILIQPIIYEQISDSLGIMDDEHYLWYNANLDNVGIPTAVKRILDNVDKEY